MQWTIVAITRLREAWFGPLLALFGLAFLTVIPVERQCFGIAARRGTPGCIFCGWNPALVRPGEPGLLLLLLFTAAMVVVPLAFSNRTVRCLLGASSAALTLGLIVATSISYDVYLAIGQLGLDLTSQASTAMLAFLPASGALIISSFLPHRAIAWTRFQARTRVDSTDQSR